MKTYTCARCQLVMPSARLPPPGAICYACHAEEQGRGATSLARAYRCLQETVRDLHDRIDDLEASDASDRDEPGETPPAE